MIRSKLFQHFSGKQDIFVLPLNVTIHSTISVAKGVNGRFPAPNEKQLPVHVRERLHKAEDAYGFIPNFLSVYARRPREFLAYFEYHDSLMSRENGNLSRGEKEMIALVTSAKQGCAYCAIAHSGLLRKYYKNPIMLEQLLVNWQQADISEREKAILSFALAVKEGKDISQGEMSTLESYGLDADDAWDIVAIMGLTTMSSHMAQFMGVQPNQDFYKMGKK